MTGAAGSVGTPSQDDPSLPSTWVSPIGRVGSDQGFIIHKGTDGEEKVEEKLK